MLDKMKELYKLRRKAKKLQDELKNTKVEVEKLDGRLKIIMTADMQIEEIKIDPSVTSQEISQPLKEAINEAAREAQKLAASKMQEIGGFDLPALG